MNKKNIVVGALVADAYSLGAHWIYDKEKIKKEFGTYEGIMAPLSDTWHKGKQKGDFTHYGDYTWFLNNTLDEKEFEYDFVKERFLDYLKDYNGYLDGATKTSLELFEKGEKYGSNSNDLSGVSMIAPIISRYPREKGIKYSLEFAKLFHNNQDVLDSTHFIANIVYDILDGHILEDVIKRRVEESSEFVKNAYERALSELEHNDSIDRLGKACSIMGALPSTLWLLLKYDNYEEAMRVNVLSGGDSSARGMIIGMIHSLQSNIPEEWQEEINVKI